MADSTKTAEQIEEERLAFRATLTEFKGRPFILPECHPCLRPDPWVVYYGIGISQKELEAYARKIGFFPNNYGPTETTQWLHAWRRSVAYLSQKANHTLDLRVPVSPDYDLVISVYSNMEYVNTPLQVDHENEVIDIILEEFELGEYGRDALWHYDLHDYEGILQLAWTPPSEEELEIYRAEYRMHGFILDYDLKKRIYRVIECTDDAVPATE
ncbi:hypothetical protein BDW22DRAFT_1430904 [Trametopsis cervina]|nr:hypothetical protein BDW22DRAFT_1430904 [Trametopsis cervina]